jgi:hypothetical protein
MLADGVSCYAVEVVARRRRQNWRILLQLAAVPLVLWMTAAAVLSSDRPWRFRKRGKANGDLEQRRR